MRSISVAAVAAAVALVLTGPSSQVSAQGESYRLVPNWPTLPAGMWFGMREAPPPPAEREAQLWSAELGGVFNLSNRVFGRLRANYNGALATYLNFGVRL